MGNSLYAVVFGLVSMVMNIVGIFLIPVSLLLAALFMWRSAPRWLPVLVVSTAVARLLTAIPHLLFHPLVQRLTGEIDMHQYSMILRVTSLINLPITIALAISIVGMAHQIRIKSA